MNNNDLTSSVESSQPDFYDLAAKFVEETSNSDQPHRLLKIWAHRFPEHAADLAAIAYARLVVPADPAGAPEMSQEALIDSARRVLHRLTAGATALSSLTAEAAARGINQRSFAALLRIDIPILAKLEQRMLDVQSIPSSLLRQLAAQLGRSVDDIINYLSAPPRLALAADYKSKQAPTVSDERQSFRDAVDSSRMIVPEDREYWQKELSNERPL